MMMADGGPAMRLFRMGLMPVAALALAAAGPPGTTLDHIAITVADQQASVAFYEGAFGLKEVPVAFPFKGGPRWLALGNGAALHIQPGRTARRDLPLTEHFAIAVPDIDAVLAWLRAHGIAWSDFGGHPGVVDASRTDHLRQTFVQDPDGYWIEINDSKAVR
jgi:lactoylglutathione lyase